MNKYKLTSSQITKDEYYSNLSINFVEGTFGGSLPNFLTAFIGGRKLSKNQVEKLKKLIDEHKEVQ
ncbi:BlaI/MecI/CopY family transcriptional regulator [Acetivibrio straminisolvens]|jgi:predicted transcriptional regulator|uniref:Transcriptional repressor n=1 Tax=Acetivibrio straminisolvens JCM 21531 TaxID=1294263 RepID=W4V2Q0_9FIRM|nr:BlaI/MecI/CopY family transcriptional regulator [Acetivibrio straminisolvens]GAE86989.1 transcriptional repressor [Acetivibrio straminisolvens JCM 21531]